MRPDEKQPQRSGCSTGGATPRTLALRPKLRGRRSPAVDPSVSGTAVRLLPSISGACLGSPNQETAPQSGAAQALPVSDPRFLPEYSGVFTSNTAPSSSTSIHLVLAQIAFVPSHGVIFSACTSHPVNTESGSGIRNLPGDCFLESAEPSPNLLLCPVEPFLPISSFTLHFSPSPLYACPSLRSCHSPSFLSHFTGGDRMD